MSEAHASDDRRPVAYAEELGIKEHTEYAERCQVAEKLVADKKLNIPFLVDGMDNKVAEAYLGHPDRLYLVRRDGRLGVAGKRGPFGFVPALEEAEEWLESFKETGVEPEIVADVAEVVDEGETTEAREEPAAGAEGARGEILAACKKAGEGDGLVFEVKTEEQGGFGRGGDGGASAIITGAYRKGLPVRLEQGDVSVYRTRSATVYRTEEGAWEVFDPSSAFGRGGPGGRGGRPGGGEEGGGRRGAGGRRGRPGGEQEAGGRGPQGGGGEMMQVMNLHRLTLPQSFLAGAADRIGRVKKIEKEGKTLYQAELTDDAAREIAGGGMGRGPGGGGNAPETEGTVRFEITSEGRLASFEIDTTLKMSFGERGMERRRKTTFTFKDGSDVKLDVPEEVKAKLSS